MTDAHSDAFADAELVAGPGAINVTEDGKVKKRVLVEGHGDLPPKHARCLVHYVARLAESGELFMDTRSETDTSEAVPVIAGRTSGMRDVGLNLGVATMRQGEKARLWVHSQYGYGDKGSFSFPTVPPQAPLVYDVELLAFDSQPEKETGSMMFEERLDAAERRRIDGNVLFGEGQYADAVSKYVLGLSFFNEDFLLQVEGVFLDQVQAVRLPLLLNLAAAKLKLGVCHEAAACCTEVLTHQPDNVKALFRRGKARAALGQTEEAAQDLQRARRLDPQDQGIARELQLLSRTEQQERQAQKKLFGGKFRASKGLGLYEEEVGAGGGTRDAVGLPQGGLWRALASLFSWLWRVLQRIFGVPISSGSGGTGGAAKQD